MSAQTTLADTEPEIEPGERRKFWTDRRAKKKFISRRGRRRMPTDTLISNARGEHWVEVEETDTDGVSLFEWVPPEPTPAPRELNADVTSAVAQSSGSIERVPLETDDQPEGVADDEADSDEGEVSDDDNSGEGTETQPPIGASVSVLEETEHATLFQQGGYYIVENHETGESVSLPGDEWEAFASYFKRGSHSA